MTLIDYTYQKQNYISDSAAKRIMDVYKEIEVLRDDGVVSEGYVSFDYLRDLSIESYLNSGIKRAPIKDIIDTDISTNVKSVGTQTVYTPKGTKMTLTKYEFVSSSAAAYINKQMDAAYPNAVRFAPASAHYNCHSYAWYSASAYNLCWMEPEQALLYIADGSYSAVTNFNNIVPRYSTWIKTIGLFIRLSCRSKAQSIFLLLNRESGLRLNQNGEWRDCISTARHILLTI